jgi:hypothetical protein
MRSAASEGRVRKVAAGLLALAVLLSAAFLAHGVGTGIAVPYPDPTPEQAAFERYHQRISLPLCLAAVVAWLAAGAALAACAVRWLLAGGRAAPGTSTAEAVE